MPKVKKEYFEEKAQDIVDGALRVCRSKPAYSVTLKDVVRECGISQGGIYCYFSDIDEIFVEILNRCYRENRLSADAFQIFDSGKKPEKIICDSFSMLGEMLDSIISKYGNLIYELNALYLGNPIRGQKIQPLIEVTNDGDMFLSKLIEFIGNNIVNGDFKPSLPKEHLLFLVGITFQGITYTSTFTQNSDLLRKQYGIEKNYASCMGMMKIFSQALIQILKTENEEETK
jgi:AcrR family transcriptional regulator